jgi:hypothetical protein
MESPPILYGKDVNTGAITQLNSIGNLLMLSNKLDDLSDVIITTPSTGQSLRYNGTNSKWENVTKDYLHLTVLGSAVTTLYKTDVNLKSVLITNSTCWTGNVPNPLGGIGGYIYSNLIPNYSQNDGWITLKPLKTYRIDATASMYTWALATETLWESRIVSDIQGSNVIAFAFATQFRDYLNVTMNMSAFYTTPAGTGTGIGLRITLKNRAMQAVDNNVASGAEIDYA